jgi:iron-regulated transporter 1
MNSQMRRIDLFCKLVAPLFISLIDSFSPEAAILATGGMTMLSVLVEYLAIARVHTAVPLLRAPKSLRISRRTPIGSAERFLTTIKASFASTATYVSHGAFLPSFSLALLYLTVLSFNGQMVTYLLAIGFSSATIGILRGVSAVFELSATWAAPRVMERIGPIRSGIWFINWEIICVSIACLLFWLPENGLNGHLAAGGTVAAVIMSRIGLWGFDLSAQLIVQEEVEPELRGNFSSQEFAFQNIFEMLSFASTIVFSRPTEFKIPATVSAGAVGLSGVLYAAFVRSRRGHLVHLSRCMERAGKYRGRQHYDSWQPLSQDEDAAASSG